MVTIYFLKGKPPNPERSLHFLILYSHIHIEIQEMKRSNQDICSVDSKRTRSENHHVSKINELEYQVMCLRNQLSSTIEEGSLQLGTLSKKISEMEVVHENVVNENLALKDIFSKAAGHIKHQENTIVNLKIRLQIESGGDSLDIPRYVDAF